jgi:hypothetical protein
MTRPQALSFSVDAPSKACRCGRSVAGIAGLSPARDIDVCLL